MYCVVLQFQLAICGFQYLPIRLNIRITLILDFVAHKEIRFSFILDFCDEMHSRSRR